MELERPRPKQKLSPREERQVSNPVPVVSSSPVPQHAPTRNKTDQDLGEAKPEVVTYESELLKNQREITNLRLYPSRPEPVPLVAQVLLETPIVPENNNKNTHNKSPIMTSPNVAPQTMDIPANPLQRIVVDKPNEDQEFIESHHSQYDSELIEEKVAVMNESPFFLLVKDYYEASLERRNISRQHVGLQEEMLGLQKEVWSQQTRVVAPREETGESFATVVVPEFTYDVWSLQEDKWSQYAARIHGARDFKFNVLMKYEFKTKLAFLVVDSFISEFLSLSPLYRTVTLTDPVVILEHVRDSVFASDVAQMQDMVATLFHFQRLIPEEVDETDDLGAFLRNVWRWLHRLIAIWTRAATFDDFCFVLTHCLCAKQIALRGPNLVTFPSFGLHGYNLQLTPLQERYFLSLLRLVLSPHCHSQNLHVLTGFERLHEKAMLLQQSPSNPFLLSENDFVAVFQRVPLQQFISHVFTIKPNHLFVDDQRTYDLMFQLVLILSSSLSTFMAFKQFVQLISESLIVLFKYAARYTADRLHSYANHEVPEARFIKGTFDHLTLLAYKRIFIHVRHNPARQAGGGGLGRGWVSNGIWQFLCHLPYDALSTATAYHLFSHSFSLAQEPGICSVGMDFDLWTENQTVSLLRSALVHQLRENPEAEYLLRSWCQLAIEQGDRVLARIVLYELFQFGCLITETRDMLMKPVRDMLTQMCEVRPHLLSDFMALCQKYSLLIRADQLYLWHNLPLQHWAIHRDELRDVCEWLGDAEYGPMSQLAQFILSRLSWQQNPSLNAAPTQHVLEPSLHRHVLFWAGEKYAQLLAASKAFWSVRQDFQKFRAWFLKFALMPAPARSRALSLFEVESSYLKSSLPITRAAAASFDPLLSFIILQVSAYGSDNTLFQREGVVLLYNIVQSKMYAHALKVIYDSIPVVFDDVLLLPNNTNSSTGDVNFFRDIVSPFLVLGQDQSPKINASVNAPYESINSHHFVQCVCSEVLRTAVDKDDLTVAKDLHCFWINALINAPGWMNNEPVCFMLNKLINLGYCLDNCERMRVLLREQYGKENERIKAASQWGVSSVVSGLVSSVIAVANKILWNHFEVRNTHIYLSLEICLFELEEEKEEWLNLGKKMIGLSDPNLVLATRQWSICSIANICLIISETDSTALIWWRLFFYRYFAFIAAGTGSSAETLGPSLCGYYAHRVLAAQNPNFLELLRKRLNVTVIYYKEEIQKLENASVASANLGLYQFYVEIYKAMRHWLGLNLALTQSHPHNLLKDPNTPHAAYLHDLLKSNEVELRTTLRSHIKDVDNLFAKVEYQTLPWTVIPSASFDPTASLQGSMLMTASLASSNLFGSSTTFTNKPQPDLSLSLASSHLFSSSIIGSSSLVGEHSPRQRSPLPLPFPELEDDDRRESFEETRLTDSVIGTNNFSGGNVVQPHIVISPAFVASVKEDIAYLTQCAQDYAAALETKRSFDDIYLAQLKLKYSQRRATKNRAFSYYHGPLGKKVQAVLNVQDEYFISKLESKAVNITRYYEASCFSTLSNDMGKLSPRFTKSVMKDMKDAGLLHVDSSPNSQAHPLIASGILAASTSANNNAQSISPSSELASGDFALAADSPIGMVPKKQVSLMPFQLLEVAIRLLKTTELLVSLGHEAVRENSINLFFLLLSLPTDQLYNFYPSRYIIKFILRKLAQLEYIGNDPLQVDHIIKATINQPKQLHFLSPCLNPNICMATFETLFNFVLENSIDKSRSHVAYASLLKRFDVLLWLRQLNLAGDALTSVTNRMISRVLKRLTVAHAAQTQKSGIWQQLLALFRDLNVFNFPHSFDSSINFVFVAANETTDAARVEEDAWLAIGAILDRNFLTSSLALTILNWIGDFLGVMRNSFGSIYQKWDCYIKPLAIILNKLFSFVYYNDKLSLEENFEVLFRTFDSVYSPLLAASSCALGKPNANANASPAKGEAPWRPQHATLASEILSSFNWVVKIIGEKFSLLGVKYMRRIFDYLFNLMDQDEYIQIQIRAQLTEIQWHLFTPLPSTPHDFILKANQFMNGSPTRYHCFFFLIDAMVKINWNLVVSDNADSSINFPQYYLHLLEMYFTMINFHPLPLSPELLEFFLRTSAAYPWGNFIPLRSIINPGIICDINLWFSQQERNTLWHLGDAEVTSCVNLGEKVNLMIRIVRNAIGLGKSAVSLHYNETHIGLFSDYITLITFYLTYKPSYSNAVLTDVFKLILSYIENNIKFVDNNAEIEQSTNFQHMSFLLSKVFVLFNVDMTLSPPTLLSDLDDVSCHVLSEHPYCSHLFLKSIVDNVYPEHLDRAIRLVEKCIGRDVIYWATVKDGGRWSRILSMKLPNTKFLLAGEKGNNTNQNTATSNAELSTTHAGEASAYEFYVNNLISKSAFLTLSAMEFQRYAKHKAFSTDIIHWVDKIQSIAPKAEIKSILLWEIYILANFTNSNIDISYIENLERLALRLVQYEQGYSWSASIGTWITRKEPTVTQGKEFKLITKLIGTFLLSQMVYAQSGKIGSVRTKPTDELHHAAQAKSEISVLQGLKAHANYKEHSSCIEYVVNNFIFDPAKTIGHIHELILYITSSILDEKKSKLFLHHFY